MSKDNLIKDMEESLTKMRETFFNKIEHGNRRKISLDNFKNTLYGVNYKR